MSLALPFSLSDYIMVGGTSHIADLSTVFN